MADINIVLIEPQIPQNTGNIARTCSATGAALHLVGPLGFEIDDKKMKRAGLDYWNELEIYYYDSAAEFFEKNAGESMFFFSKKASRVYTEAEYPKRVFLVFGKETTGLDESLLHENFERTLRLPMREGKRSLNLSNTVAVAVYEVLRRRDFESLLLDAGILSNDVEEKKQLF
ncbi:MAG: tRNA (cytidine(34)-2'-O)-methyltransferase [Eubacteriales bacterium]